MTESQENRKGAYAMSAFYDKFKTKKPNNIETKAGLIAWAFQIFGQLLVHIFALVLFGIATAFVVVGAWGVKTWFMILLAVACIGVCIAGISAIVIDICNIVYLIQEIHRLKKER